MKHDRTEFRIVLSRDRRLAAAGVSAGSDRFPALRPANSATPSERGLRLIEALCQAWGAGRVPGGKVVWATVAAPAPDRPSDGTKPI